MLARHLPLYALLSLAASSAQAALRAPASAASASGAHLTVFGSTGAAQRAAAGLGRLDGTLAQVALSGATSPDDLQALNPAAHFRVVPPLAVAEVLVDAVTAGDPQTLKTDLAGLGMDHVSVYSNDVGGWLPVSSLAAAARLGELVHVRAAMPRTRSPVATQGDYAAQSYALRAGHSPLTGSGVTVGVLSDSFNCFAVYEEPGSGVPASGNQGFAPNGYTADYATDQSTSALPGGVIVLEEAGAVNSDTCMDYGAPQLTPYTDEGRAILQIVHVVAPDASLAFHTAVEGEADFAAGIGALAGAGAKVIDDDVGYPDEPFFQDGVVAQAVDTVEANGVAYFSSAGNDGNNSWESAAPSFPVTSTTAPNSGEKLLNFDTTGKTTATALSLKIPPVQPGVFIFLVVQWDQPYLTGAANSSGARNQLDLCVSGNSGNELLNYGGNQVSACTGPNTIGDDPYQILIIGNPANASGNTKAETITVSIGLANGTAAPGRVKFMLADDGYGSTIDPTYSTNSPTLQGHPGAAGAAGVGAAFYGVTPLCNAGKTAVLESFSSVGGDPILFDVSGNRLTTQVVRQKPDFVAPDGINTTFLGFPLGEYLNQPTNNFGSGQCANNPNYDNFFGTSAAAPHAAAAAALMLQGMPAATPERIYSAFRETTSSMGGLNYDSGYGFIQANEAYSALSEAVPAAPSLSANPSQINFGSSTTLTWSAAGNSTYCTASGGWSGSLGPQGSQSVTPGSSGTATYMLTCGNAGGNSSATTLSVPVTLAVPPAPSISASPTQINLGSPTTVSWSSPTATSCTASGAWTGNLANQGSEPETPTSTGTATYTLTCANSAGTSPAASANVTVNQGGGGGGGFGGASLLGLGLLAAARRRPRLRRCPAG